VIGIHLTDVPFWHSLQTPADPSPSERNNVEAHSSNFQVTEAPTHDSGRKPQTLADGLSDSPSDSRLVVEKIPALERCDGDLDAVFTKDEC